MTLNKRATNRLAIAERALQEIIDLDGHGCEQFPRCYHKWCIAANDSFAIAWKALRAISGEAE